jgi:hypothetical protein
LQQYKYLLQNIVGNRDVSFVLTSLKDSEFVKVVRIEIHGYMGLWLADVLWYRGPANNSLSPLRGTDILTPTSSSHINSGQLALLKFQNSGV